MDTKNPKPYTKPTPGPWRMIARPSREAFCINGPEYVICPDICAASLEQLRANAALIAAAPDLLEACQWALNTLRDAVACPDGCPEELEASLVAAIAKAKGRA